MNGYVLQPRSSAIGLGGTNWLAKLLARMFRRRSLLSADRLPDHLMRDAGLQRIVGVIGRRPR